MDKVKSILVMCTGNSCRSQMAHGYLKSFLNNVVVLSAGTERHGLNQRAVAVMAEDGIDISNHTSNLIEEYADESFDLVITVCDHAKESCPIFPGRSKMIHQNFKDPSKLEGSENEIHQEFVAVRNSIKEFCRSIAAQIS